MSNGRICLFSKSPVSTRSPLPLTHSHTAHLLDTALSPTLKLTKNTCTSLSSTFNSSPNHQNTLINCAIDHLLCSLHSYSILLSILTWHVLLWLVICILFQLLNFHINATLGSHIPAERLALLYCFDSVTIYSVLSNDNFQYISNCLVLQPQLVDNQTYGKLKL